MHKQRRLKDGYAAINRNLCNYPLARDSRVRARWRRSKKTDRWLCDLRGDERIQFRLPSSYKRRRCPTGFDMNVLFVLLREARLRDSAKIEFPSLASFLKELGVRIDDYNRHRHRLRDSLALWSAMRICHRHWFHAMRRTVIKTREEADARARRTKHVRKILPPAIRSIKTDSRRVCITVAKEWRMLAKHYYSQVPLPLPLNAAAQNLVLCLLNSPRHPQSEPNSDMKWNRPIRALCRKLGLNHATRRRALDHAIEIAEAWFADRGKKLFEVHRDGLIIFVLSDLEAKVERQHVRKQAPPVMMTEPEEDDDENEVSDAVFDMDGNPVH